MGSSPGTAVYEIRIQGHLDFRRARRFEGMAITHLPGGVTVLIGPVLDQAVLYGMISLIRDLGMPLLSVKRRDLDEGSEIKEG